MREQVKKNIWRNTKKFQCSKCRAKISPTAGTIFNKSDTPLTLWFQAILIFSNAKSGISSKQLADQLEVTYKCAWRILSLIRRSLHQAGKISGIVESDQAYFGGKFTVRGDNRRWQQGRNRKALVIGAIERDGEARARMIGHPGSLSTQGFIRINVKEGSKLYTDSAPAFQCLEQDYNRHKVDHSKKEYVRGNIHVNNVETFWSHVKRSMRGTFKSVSKQHFQSYLDAFVWHRNNRHNGRERFASLLDALLQPVG
ncbi:MAG: IS1595 family transposase [Patescibacteria group bacterium]